MVFIINKNSSRVPEKPNLLKRECCKHNDSKGRSLRCSCLRVFCGSICGIFVLIIAVFAGVGVNGELRAKIFNKLLGLDMTPQPFNPNVTDVEAQFMFLKPEVERYIQPLKDFTNFETWGNMINDICIAANMFLSIRRSNEYVQVEIKDARKVEGLTYEETGFTLLDHDFGHIQNYTSEEGIAAYKSELLKVIKELHPDVKKVAITVMVYRDITHTNKPATGFTHLDFYPDLEECLDFSGDSYIQRPDILVWTNTEGELVEAPEPSEVHGYPNAPVWLGLWKPVHMETPVCDYPLAVMDARTLKKSDVVKTERTGTIKFVTMEWTRKISNLSGAIRHSKDQQWYYYSMMKENEILVLTHFTDTTTGRDFHANPHSAFFNPNCPEDFDTRRSVEARALLSF